MKRLFIIAAILVAMTGTAAAAPFLVADPSPLEDEVRWYRITNTATGEVFRTDYGNQHPEGPMIIFDFAEHSFAPGSVPLEVRAVSLGGESAPVPFVFTMPSASPGLPSNIGLMP